MRSRGRLTAVFLGAVTALLLSAGAQARGLGGPWVLGVLVIGGQIATGLMLIRRRTAQPATAPRRLSTRRG